MKFINWLFVLGLAGYVLAFDYDPVNDIYHSSYYPVSCQNINTSTDLYNAYGTHQSYINSVFSNIDLNYPPYDPDKARYNIELKDRFKNTYISDLSYLDGYFSKVLDINGHSATGYLLKSEKGSTSTDAPWNNLIIMADGIDAGNSRTIYQIATDPNFKSLISPTKIDNGTVSTPLSAGYDILFVDFRDGAGDIRTNAKYMLAIIEYACAQAKTSKVTVGGFSMGGQVCRLAMLYGQKLNGGVPCANISNVSKFISVDSPNNGALIPINLQTTLDWFAHGSGRDVTDKMVGDQVNWTVDNILNSPAAIQMLKDHYKYPNGSEKIKFYQFLKDMGNYPNNVRKYSVVDANCYEPYPNLYPQQSNYRTLTINNHDVYINKDDLPAGSYNDLFKLEKGATTRDFQFLNWLAGSNIGGKTYPVVYNNGASSSDRFKPTFVSFLSAIDAQRGIPENLKSSSNRKFINRSNGFTPFDQVYWVSTIDEHITFNSELISNIMKCSDDKSTTNPLLYQSAITSLLLD
jgi:hypothetical protein